MKAHRLLTALSALFLAAPFAAQANIINFSGSNVGGVFYNGPGTAFDGPSARFDFSVTGAGLYSFSTLSATFDTVLSLYPGTVNLAAPVGLIAQNDDNFAGTTCGITGFCSTVFALAPIQLTPGTLYSLIISGFVGQTGTFSGRAETIIGGGEVRRRVPEPATLGLLGLGLMGLGISRRRRLKA